MLVCAPDLNCGLVWDAPAGETQVSLNSITFFPENVIVEWDFPTTAELLTQPTWQVIASTSTYQAPASGCHST